MRRQKEVAVRLALGAEWRHISRMLFTETGILCAIALGAGIATTATLLGSLSPVIETQLGRPAPSAAGITIDANVLLIVGGISLLAAVALSLVPLTSWGRGVTNALQQDARVASEGRPMRRLRHGLIALEIAGSLVLLVACGLMIRSVVQMMNTDLGFDPAGLNASRIMLRARNYPDPAAYRSFHERFAGGVKTVTGSNVVFSSWPPFVPPPEHLIEPDAGEAGVSGGIISVSAGYFSTFGIAIRQGREFTGEEASAEAPVAVISETLARRLWPAGGALGRRVRNVARTQGGSTPGPWRTVVGIAGDVRQTYDDGDRGDFYMPRTPDGRFGTFYVRSSQPGPVLFDRLQRAAAEIDRDAVINPPHLVVNDDQTLAATRFLTWMLAGFAAIAAFLAMLGMYGVTAYAVQQRQKEVAIRTALGASRGRLMGIFMREGAVLLGAGTAVGLFGGAATSRVLRSQMFGVQPFDALTYAMACALLLAAGFAAVFIAARRVSVANPVTALNSN
jgi:putative ABC transport system permease protein